MNSAAEIERCDLDGVRVVAVAGEVDVSNVGALQLAVGELSNEALGIVVDLSAATYIDSATVGLLFRLRSRLGRRGQVLRVSCPQGSSARRVLELTGFDRQAPPFQDRDAAVDAIRREVPLGERMTLTLEESQPTADVAHEVEQRLRHDPEEQRGGAGENGDKRHLGL
jgi:anti-anti-sigma factor